MRGVLIALMLTLISYGATRETPKLRLSQIPNGTISGSSYVNEALGFSYPIPEGWKGDPEPKSVLIDSRSPDKVANKCSRILLWATPVAKREGRFSPIAIVFVADPACLRVAAFPQSLEKMEEINKVARKVGDSFNYSPFMSPYGNKVHPFSSDGRVIIQADGALLINSVEGVDPKTEEPLAIHTSFRFTETNGLLIVWAYMADDSAETVLKPLQVTFTKK